MSKPHYVKKKGEWWKFYDQEHYTNYLNFILRGGLYACPPSCVSNEKLRITA